MQRAVSKAQLHRRFILGRGAEPARKPQLHSGTYGGIDEHANEFPAGYGHARGAKSVGIARLIDEPQPAS